ncbi:MAG: HypC/HybG/HupF family hydrogenase formation chaperone [Planctomycetia bacterium]|nr:HypC/HybG/HupF family hydrogenase formation chaperone [Planctomycetia bacterium]
MCLSVPGKIETIVVDDPLMRKGKVNFGGIVKEVCLAYVPDAKVNNYVIVHAGFAISTVDEKEAMDVFKSLEQMGELEESGPNPS